MSIEVRTRFAPSPTGYLHIGGVRTALYNYLHSRKNNGKFILRIEDTDTSRSKDEYTSAIRDGLKWLGLDWDEGPLYQSERLELYKEKLEILKEKNLVYKCFCCPDRLKEEREKAKKEGKTSAYSGSCRNLEPKKIKELEESGAEYAWRFKVPRQGKIFFKDGVKKETEFELETISDFVIVRSDGMPTYNFTCTVDDADLKITHVIRGDDHLSNTPKQILIYKALGETVPEFAHLPQVHGSDGKRLSKRTGAVSLEDYIEKGYLPEALLNYLALLGWSTEDSRQLFTKEELIESFSIKRVGTSAGIFDTDKLDWINGKKLRNLSPEDIAIRASKWLMASGLIESPDQIPGRLVEAIDMEKDKIGLLSDVPDRIDFMVSDNIIYNEKAVNKRLKKPGVGEILSSVLETLENTDSFKKQDIEKAIREFVEEHQISAGKLFHPLRVAVSGRMTGPGIFELLEFIGKEKSIERVEYTLRELVEDE